VARRARVSVATVSYVMNNGPRPVAKATRERVLRVIRQLDYGPSEVARSLRLQRTRTIGLILPDTANPFYAALAKGVEDTGFGLGYSVLGGPRRSRRSRARGPRLPLDGGLGSRDRVVDVRADRFGDRTASVTRRELVRSANRPGFRRRPRGG
jgi:hypothetical protein